MQLAATGLALPLLGMMILTLVVWVYMFITRIRYAQSHQVDIEEFKTPADIQALIPGDASAPANNLKNLFELPVVFYAVCLYLTVTGQVGDFYVTCAWTFLLLRIVHSLVHCTYNRVSHRFIAYMLSSIALWLMVLTAFFALL
ncbi:MAG: MAPEG family protein [Pseudomonadota bacterium]